MAFFLPNQLIDDFGPDKTNNKYITEQVMWKEIDHLTKMVSNCKLNHYYDNLNMVLTFLGNYWVWPRYLGTRYKSN